MSLADQLKRARRAGVPLVAIETPDPAEVRRVSMVEPCTGGWEADLGPCGGPVLSPHRLRGDALAAERAWLERQLIGGYEFR